MSTATKSTETPKLTSFHFDLGNSTVGPIGMCARITSTSRERALEILKQRLPETIEIKNTPVRHGEQLQKGEEAQYITVYISTENITVKDSNPDNDEEP